MQALPALAQQRQPREERLTFGLQLKPIVPSQLFRTDGQALTQNNVTYTTNQRPGYAFGMFMRKNFTKRFAIETGINYVVRRYQTGINVPADNFSDSLTFRIIGYEIPVQGLVYVRLGERMYMNNAFGLSVNMFPSNVGAGNVTYGHLAARKAWVQLGLIANHGYEFRSKNSGTFYIGASIQRPFDSIYKMGVKYETDTRLEEAEIFLDGTYFTIDFRYAFHEEPEKKGILRRQSEKRKLREFMPW